MNAWSIILSLVLFASAGAGAVLLEVEQITRGPKHHFFGYIGHVQNIPWNQSGRYILALRTDFQDRMPTASDAAEIVMLDTHKNYAARIVDRTRAWNPQQGTMFYWNPEAPETQFFFNDRDPKSGKIFCVLFDISKGENGRRIREYRFDDTPVGNSGVAQTGGWFLAINYARMARLRPVTGYPEAWDWTRGERHPANDGVFKINVASGEKRLLVSFEQLGKALRPLHPEADNKELFINHTLCNREGDRIFFFVRGDFDVRARRLNQPFLIKPDGSGLKPMKQFIGGHPEWDTGHRMIGALNKRQVIYDTDREEIVGTLGDEKIIPDPEGDIALSPDGRWLVNGSRQDGRNVYVFFRRVDGVWVRSEGFDVRGWTTGDLRIDAAPCWNRRSNQILFPALAGDEGKTRQLFLIRLKE